MCSLFYLLVISQSHRRGACQVSTNGYRAVCMSPQDNNALLDGRRSHPATHRLRCRHNLGLKHRSETTPRRCCRRRHHPPLLHCHHFVYDDEEDLMAPLMLISTPRRSSSSLPQPLKSRTGSRRHWPHVNLPLPSHTPALSS